MTYEYFNQTSSKKPLFSNFNLDVNIINAIITNGLDGQLEFEEIENELYKWVIKIKNQE
jgi:hypothetical protein